MRKKLFYLALIPFLCGLLLISSCEEIPDENNPFVGKWEHITTLMDRTATETLVFKNKTFQWSFSFGAGEADFQINGKYTYCESSKTLTLNNMDTFTYSFSENTLTLSDDAKTTTYIKQ